MDGLIDFSKFSDQKTREKYEDVAVMIASVGIAESIPVLGEIQMGLQFLDSIDPYGYNQAFTRDTLNKIFSEQYGKIADVQTSIGNCLESGDESNTDCGTAGITADFLNQYKSLDPSVQAKVKKSMTSWATPYSPDTGLSKLSLCTYATDPSRMQNCPDAKYKQAYTEFYNQNIGSYSADVQKAREDAINKLQQQLEGTTTSLISTKGMKFYFLLLGLVWLLIYFLLK